MSYQFSISEGNNSIAEQRIYRKGGSFNCELCGKLFRVCAEHNPPRSEGCPSCKGDLKKVGVGNALLGGAIWFRCVKYGKYFMLRRGELVEAQERDGFKTFT